MASYENNPVGTLQERFQSKCKGSRPQYKIVRAEGAAHAPTFSYQVILGDLATVGRGSSKKQAKEAAARAMLDKLETRKDPTGDNCTHLPSEMEKERGAEVGNTVGALQEYCVKRAYPFPCYEPGVNSDLGDFSVVCCVGKLREVGMGDNKKDAKKNAAWKMINKLGCLMGTSSLPVPMVNMNDQKTTVDQMSRKLSSLSLEKIETVDNKEEDEVAAPSNQVAGQKQLQIGKHEIVHVKNIDDSIVVDHIELLKNLGKKNKFVVTCVEVKDNCDDSVKCLIQCGTVPVVVSYEVGADVTSAFNEAAKCSLYYWKILSNQHSQREKLKDATCCSNVPQQCGIVERDVEANLGQGCVATLGQSRTRKTGGGPMFPPHVGGSRIDI